VPIFGPLEMVWAVHMLCAFGIPLHAMRRPATEAKIAGNLGQAR
jgi:hypothetical protein